MYHTPPEQLPALFAEFHRTLAPGGHLLLGTYTGDDEQLSPARAFGHHRVFYRSYLMPPARLSALLAGAGLSVTAELESLPPPAARTRPQACLLARKPA